MLPIKLSDIGTFFFFGDDGELKHIKVPGESSIKIDMPSTIHGRELRMTMETATMARNGMGLTKSIVVWRKTGHPRRQIKLGTFVLSKQTINKRYTVMTFRRIK